METVAGVIANLVDAIHRCKRVGNTEWEQRHTQSVINIADNYLPHGSGVDNGTHVDIERSTGEKLYLRLDYHHMNDGGYYDGWTEYTVIVRPQFHGVSVSFVAGRDRNGVKDYLAEILTSSLEAEYKEPALLENYSEGRI